MNARERLLAIAALGAVVLAGLAVMAYQFFLVPIDSRKMALRTLQDDLGKKQERIEQITTQRAKLTAWRQLSLPGDVEFARREYSKYLVNLLTSSHFAPGATVSPKAADARTNTQQPGVRRAEPVYTRLVFDVKGQASLDNVVDLLQRFYHTSLLHKIDKLQVRKPVVVNNQQRSNELNVEMQIEALVLNGADKRAYLLPGVERPLLALDTIATWGGGPSGFALLPWTVGLTGPLGPRRLAGGEREYAAIAGKNIFYGAAPVAERKDSIDVTQFVYLTDITRNDRRAEAQLFDRYNGRAYRLRDSVGFNAFRIRDDEGETQVQATVVRIEDSDVIFKVGEKFYSLHIGDNVQEALRRPLKAEQLKNLGLTAASASPE